MNKIPYASQNMEAKTLPADVCVFGHFRRLSSTAVHSADSWFDSRINLRVHVSSIVTYLRTNSFLLRWNSCKQRSESLTRCWFWSTASNHFEHSFLIDKCKMQNGHHTVFWYLQLLCYLTQLNLWLIIRCSRSFLVFFETSAEFRFQHHLCLYNCI